MITLRKSFEYQNYLTRMFDSTLTILGDNGNVTNKEQKHKKKASYANVENETVVLDKNDSFKCDVNQMVDFAYDLLNESEKLSESIENAKCSDVSNFDSMISMNIKRHSMIDRLDKMSRIKSSEVKTTGTGYKFNENGDQVPYRYEIEEVTTIDFDRPKIKKLAVKIREISEDTSDKVDAYMINKCVDYDPKYEIGESLDDCIEKFLL